MKGLRKAVLTAFILCSFQVDALPIARKIIVLWDSDLNDITYTGPHQRAEMALNHLGLIAEYHDVHQRPPSLESRTDVRGVFMFFQMGMRANKAARIASWLERAFELGKKVVIIGEPGFFLDRGSSKTLPRNLQNRVFRHLGLRKVEKWISAPFDFEVKYADPYLYDFERRFSFLFTSFNKYSIIDKKAVKVLLSIGKKGGTSKIPVAFLHNKGAFIIQGFAAFSDPKKGRINKKRVDPFHELSNGSELFQWYVNPFELFRLAFDTDDLPKPDASTSFGRQIYYSHIDGDGWNSRSIVEDYRHDSLLTSEVILKEAIMAYPDLPITVSAIAADLDPEWEEKENSREVARKIFEQPQVEVASHTYSHPFQWEFFEDGDADKELAYLDNYEGKVWGKAASGWGKKKKKIDKGYTVPRGYAAKKFDIDLEIAGSIKTISDLSPKNKPVKVLLWSGNTLAFEEAIKKSRQAGVKNMNGGDTRLDDEFDSYGFVAPWGRQVGSQLQIYSAFSNENTYTDLWNARFHGFRYVVDTAKRTESPIRVKPFNLYYHMYSAENDAGLGALLHALNYARHAPLAPMTVTHAAGIVEGFFSTRIEKIGKDRWALQGLKQLNTLRFDRAAFKKVDFKRSQGVIGQKHYQGSLYVHLDVSVHEPIVALVPFETPENLPTSKQAYVVESRWTIQNFKAHGSAELSFDTFGFGDFDSQFMLAAATKYRLTASRGESVLFEGTVETNDAGVLPLKVKLNGLTSLHMALALVAHE